MSERWSYSVEDYGYTVSVYERTPGGVLYISVPRPGRKGADRYLRRSLGHRDKQKAKGQAKDEAGKLTAGLQSVREGRIQLRTLFALYERARMPGKGEIRQKMDRRRLSMFRRVFGAETEAASLSLREWDAFIQARRSGAIDGHGRKVPPKKRRRVRASTVNADLYLLRAVLHWGRRYRPPGATRTLLESDPTSGYPFAKAGTPRRPVASQDRYDATMEVAHKVTTRWKHGPRMVYGLTYLPEILTVLAYTGRRLNSVRQLRARDLRLARTNHHPHGAIRWPEDTDKEERHQVVPLHPKAREALDRQMDRFPVIGDGCVFPSCKDPAVPIARSTVTTWLKKAEKLARLPKLDGGLWHPYRRKWATERKHHPVKDVMHAGGWTSLQVFERSYLHADEETTLRVILEPGELRDTGSE